MLSKICFRIMTNVKYDIQNENNADKEIKGVCFGVLVEPILTRMAHLYVQQSCASSHLWNSVQKQESHHWKLS
jgi:hypothetical protein